MCGFQREACREQASIRGEALTGIIRIAGFPSVMHSVILPSLKDLLVVNPKLKFNLIEDEIDTLRNRLVRGEVDYIVSTLRESRDELECIKIGVEENVLVQSKSYKGPDTYLDHDESDVVTSEYLKISGLQNKKIERRYLDNIFGLLSGVRLGLGRAVLPMHLIQNDRSLIVANKKRILEIPIYLYYYAQPFYSRLHAEVIQALERNVPHYLKRV